MPGLKPQKLTIENQRSTKMALNLEPAGWGWEMEPGAVFEISFDDPGDIDFDAPIIFDDWGVTFWHAIPSSVVWVLPDERREMM